MASRTKPAIAFEDPQEATVSDTLSPSISPISTIPFAVKEVSKESNQTIDSSLVTIGRVSEVTTSSTNPDRKSLPETLPESDLGNEPKSRAQKRTLDIRKNEEMLQRLENAQIKPEQFRHYSRVFDRLYDDDQLKAGRKMKKSKNRRRIVLKRVQVLRRLFDTRKKFFRYFVPYPKPPDGDFYGPPIQGLSNIGNTCFMNAALNSLFYIPPLYSFFRDFSGHALTELSATFKSFTQCYQTQKDMTPFLYQTVRHLPEFGNGRQNCAHSFILKFLTKLDKDLQCSSALCSAQANSRYAGKFANYQKNKCKEMHEVLSGLVENVFTCSRCFGHWSNFSYFRTLDLPITDKVDTQEVGTSFFGKVDFFNRTLAEKYLIPTEENALKYTSAFKEWYSLRTNTPISPSPRASSLDLCFEYTFRATLMTADNKFECATCGIETQHFKQSFWRHVGKVLMIHFQRFNEMTGGKLDTYVKCPNTLRIDKYLPGTGHYGLRSVINHYGSLTGGHYTAYVKVKGKWYEFNDSSVRELDSTADLFRAAYVVTYVKEE